MLRKSIKSTRFYANTPKNAEENLEWRKWWLEKAHHDKTVQDQLKTVCSQDILFWFNFAVWTYDPRNISLGLDPTVPFITYEHQDEAILEIANAIGFEDVGVRKSRDQGATCFCVGTCDWFFHWSPGFKCLLMSRDQDLVDKSGDMDALFQRVEHIHENEPYWMAPKVYRAKNVMKNVETGAVFTGSATTGGAGVGGRNTVALVDEYAQYQPKVGYAVLHGLQFTTKTRLVNSTYLGTTGAYYDLIKMMQKNGGKVITLPWWKHPVQKRGLYRATAGHVEFLDDYKFPPGYQFIHDGKLRSVYYDAECKRNPIPSQIAQDLDINPEAASAKPFDIDVIEKHVRDHCIDHPPLHVGSIDVLPDGTVEFTEHPGGRLKLWIPRDAEGRLFLPEDTFVIGADISAGTGASDSALSIVNRKTGEKVGEYAHNHMGPMQFADLAVGLARWFNGAYLIWEKNGNVGISFGKQVSVQGYSNIYYRQNEKKFGNRKPGDEPGWHTDDSTKGLLLNRYQARLASKKFINHSEAAVRECENYVFTGDGRIEHKAAATSLDPSARSDNHGDQVIADALACWVCEDKPIEAPQTKEAAPVYASDDWRELEIQKRERALAYEDD